MDVAAEPADLLEVPGLGYGACEYVGNFALFNGGRLLQDFAPAMLTEKAATIDGVLAQLYNDYPGGLAVWDEWLGCCNEGS